MPAGSVIGHSVIQPIFFPFGIAKSLLLMAYMEDGSQGRQKMHGFLTDHPLRIRPMSKATMQLGNGEVADGLVDIPSLLSFTSDNLVVDFNPEIFTYPDTATHHGGYLPTVAHELYHVWQYVREGKIECDLLQATSPILGAGMDAAITLGGIGAANRLSHGAIRRRPVIYALVGAGALAVGYAAAVPAAQEYKLFYSPHEVQAYAQGGAVDLGMLAAHEQLKESLSSAAGINIIS